MRGSPCFWSVRDDLVGWPLEWGERGELGEPETPLIRRLRRHLLPRGEKGKMLQECGGGAALFGGVGGGGDVGEGGDGRGLGVGGDVAGALGVGGAQAREALAGGWVFEVVEELVERDAVAACDADEGELGGEVGGEDVVFDDVGRDWGLGIGD